MAELILMIKLCIYFILFLLVCGVVLLLALIVYTAKVFIKKKREQKLGEIYEKSID